MLAGIRIWPDDRDLIGGQATTEAAEGVRREDRRWMRMRRRDSGSDRQTETTVGASAATLGDDVDLDAGRHLETGRCLAVLDESGSKLHGRSLCHAGGTEGADEAGRGGVPRVRYER